MSGLCDAFKVAGQARRDRRPRKLHSKPKWMRETTYDRKLEEIFAAEEIVEARFEAIVRKLDRCWGR